MGAGTQIKKGIGEFFRPRNMLSRGARIGGTAIGGMFGMPQLGYKAGDFVADKWIDKDSAKEQGPIKGFIMRGEDPTGGMLAGGIGGSFGGGASGSMGGGGNPSLSVGSGSYDGVNVGSDYTTNYLSSDELARQNQLNGIDTNGDGASILRQMLPELTKYMGKGGSSSSGSGGGSNSGNEYYPSDYSANFSYMPDQGNNVFMKSNYEYAPLQQDPRMFYGMPVMYGQQPMYQGR